MKKQIKPLKNPRKGMRSYASGVVMNKANLLKLANYLYSLPRNYKDFDMSQFNATFTEPSEALIANPKNVQKARGCGTAACAVGHAPLAGIRPLSCEDSWTSYSYRTLISCINSTGEAWEWCFSGSWRTIDNSAHGAADRIMYLLLFNDVPSEEEFNTQYSSFGFDPLYITKTKYTRWREAFREQLRNAGILPTKL